MAENSIYVIIRYSVLGGDWRMSKNATSFAEYRQQVFADERMSTRLDLFRSITAESIVGQHSCDADLYLVVLTSDQLPSDHRASLDAVIRDIQERSAFVCEVLEVPSDRDHQETTDAFLDEHFAGQPDQRFATVRLDDDDALAASFCRRLAEHLDRGLCGYPVSFAYGYEGRVETGGRITEVRHWNQPKVAAGLAHTNAWTSANGYADSRRHVYRLGRHIKIDVANAVVIDTRAPAYFKTVSEHMDSRRPKHRVDLPAVMEHEFAFDEFPWVARDSIDLPVSKDPSPEKFNPETATSAVARHHSSVRELKQEIRALKSQTRKLKQAEASQGRWSRRLASIRSRVRRRLAG